VARKTVIRLPARPPDLPAVRGRAPWPGHEHVKGWRVFRLPVDSGHVLALHVFRENARSSHRIAWHRDPGGRWSIHADGARLDTACPRCYGAACHFTGYARIGLTWAGPATLRATIDSPGLEWTLTASSTLLLDLLNTISAGMPPSARGRRPWPGSAWPARWGRASCGCPEPCAAATTARSCPGRCTSSTTHQPRWTALTGAHPPAGHPHDWRGRPMVALPARGVLATGQTAWESLDSAEYEQIRSQTAATAPAGRLSACRSGDGPAAMAQCQETSQQQ
jgi:hypothetical protein